MNITEREKSLNNLLKGWKTEFMGWGYDDDMYVEMIAKFNSLKIERVDSEFVRINIFLMIGEELEDMSEYELETEAHESLLEEEDPSEWSDIIREELTDNFHERYI